MAIDAEIARYLDALTALSEPDLGGLVRSLVEPGQAVSEADRDHLADEMARHLRASEVDVSARLLGCLHELKDDPDLCQIPVVILTASRAEVDVVNSYRSGAASYIMKPVVFQALLESITTFDLYWTLSELPS